jgi:hypothetical protein
MWTTAMMSGFQLPVRLTLRSDEPLVRLPWRRTEREFRLHGATYRRRLRGWGLELFTEDDDLLFLWPGTRRLLRVLRDHGCTEMSA